MAKLCKAATVCGCEVTVEVDTSTAGNGPVGKLTPEQWSQIVQMILALIGGLIPIVFPPATPPAV